MLRLLTTPRWLGLNALALAIIGVFGWLARWQWGRANVRGYLDLQSSAYAIQWVVFAGFIGFLWWRTLQDELHPGAAEERRQRKARRGVTPESELRAEAELAAYNRYLEGLQRQDRS